MAAHSGGTDWAAILKPFLSATSEVISKNDVLHFAKTIIQNENEILEHDAAHKQFFDYLVALAAENISNQVASLSQAQHQQITEASSILIRYVIQHLDTTAPCKPSILLMALKALCERKKTDDATSNVSLGLLSIISVSGMKYLKYPEIPGYKATSVGSSSGSGVGGTVTGAADKDSPKAEMKRSRSDLSTAILQQLTKPLFCWPLTFAALSDEPIDCTELFIKQNLQCMQMINAGDSLLTWCTTALTTLAKYRFKYEECTMLGRPLYLPVSNSEANGIKSNFSLMESDISNLLLAISLPLLEPLTPKKITLLSQCAMSALYCAVLTSTAVSVIAMASAGSQKSASSGQLQQAQSGQTGGAGSQSQKENDEEEDFARAIVDKALEIFTKIGNRLKTSTRGHIYQNHMCMGAWLLISGIQGTMGASGNTSGLQQQVVTASSAKASEENLKGRSPLKTLDVPQMASTTQPSPALRVNLFKVQQGFCVLNAAIARHSITLLTELIDDLKIDSRTDEEEYSSIESAGFDILAQYTSIQRVVRVLNSATLQQLLTFLATVSYRKACTLRRINTKSNNDGEPMSYSDSTTYFNDTFSCSEESEPEEEDSDSYLGLWFKETLSPEANEEMTESQEQENKDDKGRHDSNLVPAKDEPHEYLNLASLIFNFFDASLGGNHVYLNRYVKTGLSEQQMVLMANILRDLDRDAARGEPDNSGCLQWQNSMVKFSGAVGRYLHNLISNSLLNESLQSALLLHLGVSPWTQDSNIWPLQVYSRTLAVLVQILLLKPPQEKEAACLSVWHRLVNTLVEGVCSTQTIPNESEIEDLNVEHAQLLLFLFHSLNLMQKKSILLLTAGGVIRCSEVCRNVTADKPLRDHQIMLLSRLLLFLEYLMKHLYNPPNVLLEQVRWNLFSVFTLDNEQKLADLVNYKTKMMAFCRKDIEDKHRKLANEFSVGGVKPKFYSLTTVESKIQQEFKLDGLAWNFILCTPDKLKYPWLIDALIDILGITDMCLARIPFQTLCAVHYCFSLCWKLLLGLPPSAQHVETLMQEKSPNLHSLLWSIRCLHPITHSHYLIVNSLVKQGMYTQSAEAMWLRLTEHISDVKYSLKMTLLGLESFARNFSADQPRLSKIILLDSLVSHLYAVCWAEKEGVNVKTNKTSSTTLASSGGTVSGTNNTAATLIAASASASNDGGASPAASGHGSGTSSSTSAQSLQSSVSGLSDGFSSNFPSEVSRGELTKNLMNALLDAIEIVRESAYKTMSQNLSGQIPSCLIEPLIAIAGTKNPFCPELAQQLIACITGHDKDVITVEWRKSLLNVTEENFTSGSFPVEVHTLTVIDAHLTEVSKHLSFSVLLSLKNSLKSAINLIYYMLNYDDVKLDERLKEILIPMAFDLRTEYLYSAINKCLESLLGGDSNSEAYQLAAFSNIIRHSYQFLIEYTDLCATGRATNIEESVLCSILKYWESLLDKPMGLRAMRNFFYESKAGNLVQILLSFTGTNISQAYSTRVLQFFERLFQAAEKLDAPFDEEELCICIAELAITDSARLKSWLSHILLGPGGISLTANVSNNSSNVPTPTNMATVSAIPSITDHLDTTGGNAGVVVGDNGGSENNTTAANAPVTTEAEQQDAMDIDYECMTKGSGWQAAATSCGKGGPTDDASGEALERNGKLLQSLVKYIVAENRISSSVSVALFQALIQIGHNLLSPSQEAIEFSDLLQVMITLADAGKGRGHALLFAAAIDWLDVCRGQVLDSGKSGSSGWQGAIQLDNVTAILKYMSDLLLGLGAKGSRTISPPWDDESTLDADDILEELVGGDEEDSTVDDSDEDSLGNKLCTFSITQKDFMNQHWYYCHTCKMVDGVGVCSVCARVCHKNHDISYAKYGNFFCDCGAKEDGSCQALSRRSNSAHAEESILGSSSSGSLLPRSSDTDSVLLTATGSSIRRRRPSSPSHEGHYTSRATGATLQGHFSEKEQQLAKIIETSREALNNPAQWKTVVRCILAFFNTLMPTIKDHCARFSPVGCFWRAKSALERLHRPEKSYVLSDEIMIATLGSQEGAFENVRMNYSGEQGQTIKQLLSTNLVRRVALCCLASPHGKRQQLAISHEKGKVTILQLSALLKQADAAKRKLTLTRLASAPVPCTVLSLASNPANEDFLAVCGLKECHILTFNSSGTANDHIVLTPQLETGNFIKRAIWLPSSQTKLALVTADFVKIYDLAEDSYSPQYYFLVPSGKIRDCTFVYDHESIYHMLIMSSLGYIYTQPLSSESLAKHGPFYVTSTLELDHPLITDDNGQILAGGVSIYYSHVLQLLFFSYAAGRNFMAPLTDVNEGVKCVINLVCNPSSKLFSKATTQPLCQWTEIPGHPGLVCAMMQSLNNPVIFMIKPDGYMAQEIKAQNAKAKIMDMVAIRHSVSGVEKTTLILLCEDGSLRIYAAHSENTGYWLSSEVQPIGHQQTTFGSGGMYGKSSRKSKKTGKLTVNGNCASSSSSALGKGGIGSAPVFPIDFFEHCTLMNEVEYAGNDLLQIYNTQHLKHRLNSTGLYVTSTKANGFTLDVVNNDQNMVITGVRIQIGSQDVTKAPQRITILGRSVTTIAARARWFDIPLTREETLQSDKKLSIHFGPSVDVEQITILDSIKIYGKTKDVFGWPDESEDVAGAGQLNGASASGAQMVATTSGSGGSDATGASSDGNGAGGIYMTALDRMLSSMLHVLDNGISLLGGPGCEENYRQTAIDVATNLILYPTVNVVQQNARNVLMTCHPSKAAYHSFMDKEILSDIYNQLKQMYESTECGDVDPEEFYRAVLMMRSIAIQRPQAMAKICAEQQMDILPLMMILMKELYRITPAFEEPIAIVKRGLCHVEAVIYSLVEIIYAFALADSEQVERMTKLFVQLLLEPAPIISHSAKQAMIRLLRPKVKRRKVVLIESPPVCSTPTPSAVGCPSVTSATGSSSGPSTSSGVGGSGNGSGVVAGGSNEDYVAAVVAGGMQEVDAVESLGLESGGGNQALASLEALLGVGFPQLLETPDADDDTIMEIAIALSLQDNEADLQLLQQSIANYQGRNRNPAAQSLAAAIAGGSSFNVESNASGGGSDDDEISNVATEGSTLRTSPAGEHAGSGSGGSESGCSGVESIGGTSGRSSTYEEQPNPSPPRTSVVDQMSSQTPGFSGAVLSSTAPQAQTSIVEPETSDASGENANKLHVLRYSILSQLVDNFSALNEVNGAQCIPFVQVILMLTSDLEGSQDPDQQVLNRLLQALIDRLEIPSTKIYQMANRCPNTEVQLVILRLIGVLMGKVKSKSSSSSSSAAAVTSTSGVDRSSSGGVNQAILDNASFVAQATANALMKNNAIPYCLLIMESFLPHWKNSTTAVTTDDIVSVAAFAATSASNTTIAGPLGTAGNVALSATSHAGPVITAPGGAPSNVLLRPTLYGIVPDMQPFFARPFPKGSSDVFEMYAQILTEMAVRLPYQILKLSSGHPSSHEWYHSLCEYMTATLCEYMMYMQSPVLRRQVRKLLLYICGSKEKYRQLRDLHSLDTHMKAVKKCCEASCPQASAAHSTILCYDALVELTEHFRACQEIACIRTGNWQKFCVRNADILSSLLNISTYQLEEGVSTIILQLLQSAICNTTPASSAMPGPPLKPSHGVTVDPLMKVSVVVKDRKDRDKSEESDTMAAPSESKFDPAQCIALVVQIFNQVSTNNLSKFIRSFLLETNSTTIRWQAHSLVYAFYENSGDLHKETLLQCLWGLWPLLPAYGKRTAQFVDLLGFLTLNTRSLIDKLPDYTAQAVSVLRQQNELLSRHPNAPIYTALGQVLEIEGFFLESEPCLVCNNPEVPFSNIKLSTVKVDSKFTTTTTIVKLVQSHTISKIVLRIADLKRAKMVRTINIYYNNRTVQAVVELKNRPLMWHKARKVTLQSGQTDVKIDFSLPITACNLMIEYADFYETVSGSSESLQCPRCSAVVPANPGVCGNCGENVFQCHKCRAINYDEKDPFLCHSCGFCKYAKFDYSIYGRACCAVDPIESAEDRAKTVQTIHTSLEKADRSYKALQNNKQILELLVQKISEHKLDRALDETLLGASVVGSGGSSAGGTSQVNKVIQLLAQKYCVESKSTFEELSKIIQKVQACRKELVAYDRSQMDAPPPTSGAMSTSFASSSGASTRPPVALNKCYGCALASTEQCLTLLRAMASNMACRVGLCSQGLVQELAINNLRRGTHQLQDEVRQLLCLLTRDLPDATGTLCQLLQDRVKMALSGTVPLSSLDSAVRHEMALLETMTGQDDSCWETKLRTVIELFLQASRDARGPAIAVIHPCLRIVQSLICPPLSPSAGGGSGRQPQHQKLDQSSAQQLQDLCTVQPAEGITVSYEKWIVNDANHSFSAWKARMPPISSGIPHPRGVEEEASMQESPPPLATGFRSALDQRRTVVKNLYLAERYSKRWRQKALAKGVPSIPVELQAAWLQPILFNTNSRLGRQLACALITSLSRTNERKRELLDLLTGFLRYVGESGEASAEFIALYRMLADESPWRQYLALKGVLSLLVQLVTVEIEKIHCLEETTLSTDLAQGYALRQLVELMALFLDNAQIRKAYKGKLLGPVLQGYLDLRKLIVQRTRQIDDAQEKLLEMLEEMTTGTEEETAAFMAVCIDTVRRTPTTDVKTPVFMFERLCSIIHPEENDVGEFFLTLEKDPQQEDYLQGRMLGNPYPSNEAGLGPLMRNVKNKICIDCELVALLDDDNGMELLVHNKIISLDLPVKEVYKKVWLQEGGERDGMRIVYRMRGLLGDATEEFIETLNAKSQEEVDNEQLYRMANVLVDCDGLKVMLERIGSLQNVSKSRTLLQVLLKLFLLSVKVRRCQEVLCQPELGAINTLLRVLQLCLQSAESDAQQSAVTEQLLEIMETILSKAASDTLDSFLQFSLTFGGPEYVQALLSCTNCSNVRYNPSVLRHLIRVLAALVYGNDIKMALLCEHFRAVFDFDRFDGERSAEEEFKLELFCVLTTGIEHNSIGGTLKDYIMGLGIVDKALAYIKVHAPCVKPTLLRTDSDELKEFISRASLKYILRFLTGLATKHEATQLAVALDIIPIIHRLEQVSSDEHVGSLAENLLEALCTEPITAKRVQEVRDFTRAEKKRLAMATREKQLDALGMRTNEKGQVTAKGSILSQIEKLREETGLACFICREGYACQPNKVLGIYTFTKRANVEDFEMKQKKTIGYTTVTHFNVVHVDCHMNAIRLARSRDEWESASLQNANTRCNGLLPLWGPEVSESTFSSSMARHNNYMQECTQRCEITFASSMHDLKLLLWRFAQEKSFHEDAGGGGPQSNMHLVPYLLFYGLYTLLSSRSYSREEMILSGYINQKPSERWLECAYDAEGPLYLLTMSLALHTPAVWSRQKLLHLRRLIAVAQARHISPNSMCKFLAPATDKHPKDYTVYKPYLMFWGLNDLIHRNLFRTVTTPKDEDWPISLFNYIRRNDESLLKTADSMLHTFTEEYLPCASFAEFCDVAGLLGDIENPDEWIEELLQALPSPGGSSGPGSSGGAGSSSGGGSSNAE